MRYWLAAVLLAGIAVGNRAVVATGTLSPWDLGGFGMFASIDSPGSRVLRVTAIGPDGHERLVQVPTEAGAIEDRLRVWPTDERMLALADRLEQLTFSVEGEVCVRDDLGTELVVRRVEVLKLDDDGGVIRLEEIASLEVDSDE